MNLNVTPRIDGYYALKICRCFGRHKKCQNVDKRIKALNFDMNQNIIKSELNFLEEATIIYIT